MLRTTRLLKVDRISVINVQWFRADAAKCCEDNGLEDVKYLNSQSTASLKRGTGGRASFNGIVATVFGCSGFLGRYVCNTLGKIGTQLILPYRGDFDCMRRLRLAGELGQVVFLHYNLLDEESIRQCVKYSNVVINLVGREWETKNYTYNCVNVVGARKLAKIAREEGVEKFIHVSALNASENPKGYFLKNGSEFLKSKWAGEKAVREEFPEAVIIRPSDMYGQEDRFLKYFCAFMRRNIKIIPLYKKGEHTEKQPVYVGDVARGIAEICRNRKICGETYQAVGPCRYLLSDLVDWFFKIMGCYKHDGYKRYDISLDPVFKMRISLLPKLTLGNPKWNLHWEKLELECHSDPVDPSVPALEDLGVKLTRMEDQVPWELRAWRTPYMFDQDVATMMEVAPPQPIHAD